MVRKHKQNRPVGVTILAVLSFIQAAIFITSPITISVVLGLDTDALYSNIQYLAPLIIFGLVPILVGIALIEGKGWARILAFVFAIISLFVFPVGTIIGIIMIWYLRKPKVRAFFI